MTSRYEGSANNKCVVLGPEYDEELLRKLFSVLSHLGGRKLDSELSIAGSQELFELDVLVGEETVHVETETYVGLSIQGTSKIIDEIVDRMRL